MVMVMVMVMERALDRQRERKRACGQSGKAGRELYKTMNEQDK